MTCSSKKLEELVLSMCLPRQERHWRHWGRHSDEATKEVKDFKEIRCRLVHYSGGNVRISDVFIRLLSEWQEAVKDSLLIDYK